MANEKNEKIERMKNAKGFIGALDQSGGSTPKALLNYGIDSNAYSTEEDMYNLIHEMRSRIIKSPNFSKDKILGAILFEKTMNSLIDGIYTADFLWDKKGILPFLKVDEGLDELKDGVQLMKPIKGLDARLKSAVERNIFGTKMRSVIYEPNIESIKKIVAQQFEYAKKITASSLVAIVEPEVDINSPEKEKIEDILKVELLKALDDKSENFNIVLKLTIPTKANLYKELIDHPRVLRVVALSGGYSREKANALLSENNGMIASFSRGLSEGLSVKQTDEEFNKTLGDSIETIYQASIR